MYTHNHNDINNNSTYTYAKIQADSLLFRYEPFINFWLRFFDTRRETILKSLSWSYYANNTPNVRHISWCFRSQFIFAGRDSKNLTTAARAKNSTASKIQCQPSTPWSDFNFSTPWSDTTSQHHDRTPTNSFSKILQILRSSLSGMTSSISQPNFLSGVYYDNGDCHILCARA